VVAAGTTHDDLLLLRGSFAPRSEKSSHKRPSSYPGPPLSMQAAADVATSPSSTRVSIRPKILFKRLSLLISGSDAISTSVV
jgi:hypothetical protein